MEVIAHLFTEYLVGAPLALCVLLGILAAWLMNRTFILVSPVLKSATLIATGMILGILAGFGIQILLAKWLPVNYPYSAIKILLTIGTPLAAMAAPIALNKIKRWRNK